MPLADDLVVSVATASPLAGARAEMGEHKGIGHPDSLCDGAVEAAARALSLAYMDSYGSIQPFNLDKALLVGGTSTPKFGGGRLERPMRLIVSGPVTELPDVSVERLVGQAIREYLVVSLGVDDDLIGIEPVLRPTAPNLRRVTNGPLIPLANDTSFGVGYAPLSQLEGSVLSTAQILRSREFRDAFQAAGLDYKVMGSRCGQHLRLTIALAFIDRAVRGVDQYFTQKELIAKYLAQHLTLPCEIEINTLDEHGAYDESGIYLTVTGLSAEHGDDGEVGRGNRVNGLITPYRPMSLEAAAGKNPASHVGKLYNVLAHQLAGRIQEAVDGVDEVTVRLLSAIGRPIDQPQLTAVDVVAADGLSDVQLLQIRDLTKQALAHLPALTQALVQGTVAVF
ncbi:methionine adenosyltransferase [Cupriavidus basilensis]|uniref:methionine adenosyltransferase n=1 Tax=Cupriavidus basilensis TaxID=68895 RepID=UPI0039F729BF